MDKDTNIGRRPGGTKRAHESDAAAPGRRGRMSRQQKTATVLTTKLATGEELESDRLKARLGAALIERDLLNEKIPILEANRPLARWRLKP